MASFRSFFILIVLSFFSPLYGQSFMTNFNPSVFIGEYPISNYHIEDFLFSPPYNNSLLEEKLENLVSMTLSTMIFGCDFVFVPNSYLNQVAQEFIYTPRGKINPENIVIKSQTKTSELTTSTVQYETNPYEKSKREAWDSLDTLDSIGRAGVSLLTGKEAQDEAIALATKEAIINLYKKNLRGKPRAIEGTFIFVEPPLLGIKGGEWVAQVKLRLKTNEIIPYYPY